MTPAAASARIRSQAAHLGFSDTGITTLGPNAHAAHVDHWLAAGHAATMTWLHRQADRRRDPRRIWPQARAAVVTLTDYFHGHPAAGAHHPVAQYAWSPDYHHVVGRRLASLAAAVRSVVPGAGTRVYVDAGPVPERELAVRAGLGWVGKNMMLINPRRGSFTFIGVVLTDADLEPDPPFAADRCGSCRRCLDACPTGAFVAPRDLDSRRCVAYLTIEHRGAFTATERELVGDWLFGCDVCQDVCPWNIRFASPATDPELTPRPELPPIDAAAFLALSDAEFDTRFADTPLARAGAEGMRRNAAAVLANAGRTA